MVNTIPFYDAITIFIVATATVYESPQDSLVASATTLPITSDAASAKG